MAGDYLHIGLVVGQLGKVTVMGNDDRRCGRVLAEQRLQRFVGEL
jgi:hypothetical protein